MRAHINLIQNVKTVKLQNVRTNVSSKVLICWSCLSLAYLSGSMHGTLFVVQDPLIPCIRVELCTSSDVEYNEVFHL